MLRNQGDANHVKRLVICADGTWNHRDQADPHSKKRRPTNVTKVARAILPRSRDGIDQVVFYHERGDKEGSPERNRVFRNIHGTRLRPPIKFIGVWDSVGALGAPGFLGQLFNSRKYRYHQVGLNSCIQSAYQALAIDERRKPFAPNVWERPGDWNGVLEQAWFAGVHTNVGGSATRDGLANEALHWIVEKAESLQLAFDSRFLAYYRPCFDAALEDSMTFLYRLLGQAERRVGQFQNDGEEVHQDSNYQPANLKAFLGTNGSAKICTTTRIVRGARCHRVPTNS